MLSTFVLLLSLLAGSVAGSVPLDDTDATRVSKHTMTLEEILYDTLRTEHSINHPRLTYAIWVRQVDGRRLIDATFKRRDGKGGYDMIARAREVELRVDSEKQRILLHLLHGEVISVRDGDSCKFEDQMFMVPLLDYTTELTLDD
jgi:hypothetical protein